MRIRKFSAAVCAAVLTSLSLCAAEIDMVMSLDLPALMSHPQFVKLRSEFDRQAAAAGQKSSAERLAEAQMDESFLNSRICVYLSVESREGVVVIDTPEGEAQKWFDLFSGNEEFLRDGSKTTVAGSPALTGKTSDGQKITVLLKSPSQVQILAGETLSFPLEVGKLNKNLILASRSGRLFTMAVVPSAEMTANPQMAPQLQSLRLLTIGLENTSPETTISLEGLFDTNDAALQAKGIVDLLLFGLMQNQNVDARLVQGIQGTAENGKLLYTRKVDQGLIDAVRDLIQKQLSQLPMAIPGGDAGAGEAVQPVQGK